MSTCGRRIPRVGALEGPINVPTWLVEVSEIRWFEVSQVLPCSLTIVVLDGRYLHRQRQGQYKRKDSHICTYFPSCPSPPSFPILLRTHVEHSRFHKLHAVTQRISGELSELMTLRSTKWADDRSKNSKPSECGIRDTYRFLLGLRGTLHTTY